MDTTENREATVFLTNSGDGVNPGNTNTDSGSGNKPASDGRPAIIEMSPEPEMETTVEEAWGMNEGPVGTTPTGPAPTTIVEVDILDNFRMPAAETLAESSFDAAGVGSGISWLLAAGFLGILAIAVLLNAPGLRKKQRKTRGDTAK